MHLMNRSSRFVWRSLWPTLVMLLPLSSTLPEGKDFTPVDMKMLEWQVKEGFQAGDETGFGTNDSFHVKHLHPPMILNEIFPVQPGGGVRHFALQTRFAIDKSSLREPLVMQLAWIGENWEVFLNGKSQRREIFQNEKGEIVKYRTFRGVIVRLNYADLRDGDNLLVFHVLGDGPVTSLAVNDTVGFLFAEPYRLTTFAQITEQRAEVFFVSLYTVYFFFGLYHILIFSRRPRDIYNLFFGLFSMCLTMYGLSQTMLIYDFFDDTSIVSRLKYLPQPMLPVLFLLFVHYYFYHENRPPLFLLVMAVLNGLLSLFFILAPHAYLETGLRVFYLLLLPIVGFTIVLFIRTMLAKKPDFPVMATGLFVMILAMVFEVADSVLWNTGIRVLKYSFFLFVMSLIAVMANRFLVVHNESERLNVELLQQKNSFARFVPTQFLELLGKHSAVDIRLGDNSVQSMSVLMCDLRSFTSMAERMTPEDTFRFLNSYLARMEPIIQRYDGFVDKFVGDAILALFSKSARARAEGGDSVSAGFLNTAERALEAAIQMRRELLMYNEGRRKEGLPAIEFGTGINTGLLVLGTVGSEQRIDTTVIGNTVNLAARLESLTSYYDARIIISEETRRNLANPAMYSIRELDIVYVKGKTEPSSIYEVYDLDEAGCRVKKDMTREAVAKGIALYRSRQFAAARTVFAAMSRDFHEDRIPRIYMERCDHYLVNPPTEAWNGVYELSVK